MAEGLFEQIIAENFPNIGKKNSHLSPGGTELILILRLLKKMRKKIFQVHSIRPVLP